MKEQEILKSIELQVTQLQGMPHLPYTKLTVLYNIIADIEVLKEMYTRD